MPSLKQIIFASVFVFALLATAAAQESTGASTQSSSLTITAAAAGERVRITAPSSVVQMHVEVYAASGEKLFDQEIRGGNVFDWHLQDGQGQRLTPGTYVCVVTAKSTSGKLTQKIGTVSVEVKSVSLQPAVSKQLSTLQAQTIGPVEENSSWTITDKDELQTPTVIANDGTDGQMIRGRGALTFRIGNFFTGVDTEQMRLTEGGNLGIGTSEPQAKLDVAGTIRAQRFLVAKPKKTDGTNTMTSGDIAQSPDTADSVQPLASGSGTQDRIAKWTDNSGTLGDSVITESAGNIGLGTPTPTQALEVMNGRIKVTGTQTITGLEGILEIGTTVTTNNNQASGIRMRNTYNGNANFQQALDVAPTFAPSASISLARGFISTAFFAPPPGVTITDAYGGNANTVYNNTGGAVTNGTGFAIRTPIVFGALKPTNQYGLHILNQGIGGTTNSYGLFVDAQSGSTNNYSAIFAGGNIGIGTTTPAAPLDVRGNIALNDNMLRLRTGPDANQGVLYSGAVDGPEFRAFGGFRWTRNLGATELMRLDSSGNVGIGTSTNAFHRLFVSASSGNNAVVGVSSTGKGVYGLSSGGDGVFGETSEGVGVHGSNPTGLGFAGYFEGRLIALGNVGIGTTNPSYKLHVNGEVRAVMLSIETYVNGGTEPVCVETSTNRLGVCNSSLRYKTDVHTFLGGLDIINRLRPIAFTWKQGGMRDLGLGAEDVDKVAPLLTFRNKQGVIEGVKYNQLSAVFINAFKEQQQQIAALRTANNALNTRLLLIERTLKNKRGSIRQRL